MGTVVRWVFTYILYPATIIGVFLYLLSSVGAIIDDGTKPEKARRITAAGLPLVVLIFLVATGAELDSPIGAFFRDLGVAWAFILGAFTAALLLEVGRWLLSTDSEVAACLQVMFLSGLAAFILWMIIGGHVGDLNIALLGLVVGGGLHVIFRGAQ